MFSVTFFIQHGTYSTCIIDVLYYDVQKTLKYIFKLKQFNVDTRGVNVISPDLKSQIYNNAFTFRMERKMQTS